MKVEEIKLRKHLQCQVRTRCAACNAPIVRPISRMPRGKAYCSVPCRRAGGQ